MARLIYVIETWRGTADEPIELDDKGFPSKHWHEHRVEADLQYAIEQLIGYEPGWNRPQRPYEWDESMESIVPFACGERHGRLAFKIVLNDPDGTMAVHLILPRILPDEDD